MGPRAGLDAVVNWIFLVPDGIRTTDHPAVAQRSVGIATDCMDVFMFLVLFEDFD
jgi:hypothetical protein